MVRAHVANPTPALLAPQSAGRITRPTPSTNVFPLKVGQGHSASSMAKNTLIFLLCFCPRRAWANRRCRRGVLQPSASGASAKYVVNDLLDLEADSSNPTPRPERARDLSALSASALIVLFLALAIIGRVRSIASSHLLTRALTNSIRTGFSSGYSIYLAQPHSLRAALSASSWSSHRPLRPLNRSAS